MTSQLPLHARHETLGAHFRTEAGLEIPADYGNPEAEAQAAREGVVLADLSYQGKFIISGADASTFLQGLISNDLKAARSDLGIYTTLLTAKGKTVADFYLFPLPEGFLMEIEWGNAEKTKEYLMRFRLRSKVEMSVPAWGKLLVSGPSSSALMEELLGEPLPEMAEKSFFEKSIEAQRLICIKRSLTGSVDFHLYYPLEKIDALWQKLMSEGEALNVRAIGASALEILRVEAGKIKYGVDINEETIPVEAGIQDEVISYTKGCFPGQEVVARIKTYGHVNRVLTGLILEGEVVPEQGCEVFRGDKKVGWVTSAVHSPFLGKVIAMAYVRRELASPGTMITVNLNQGQISAEVVSLPFYNK